MKTTAGIFSSRADAERAAKDLAGLGISGDHVTVLTPGAPEKAVAQVPTDELEAPGVGRALGGVVGAAAGAAGGMQAAAVLSIVVPGVGLVIALGVAGAALLGATGAVAGGALGDALREGLPRDELFLYEDALRQGRTVVIAIAEDAAQAGAAGDLMVRAGAESIDAARQQWWLGLRPAEEAAYTVGDFTRDEPLYRQGFEAALSPSLRGRTYEEAREELARRHPGAYRDEAFRRGYERGRRHDEARRPPAGGSGAAEARR